MKRLTACAALLIFATPIFATNVHAETAPVAPRGDTVETVFGNQIADPYRWMEGADNAAFTDWLKAQGAVGRQWLDASPALDTWRATLSAAGAATTTNRAQHRVAGRIFFLRLEQGKQGVLMERLADGTEKVLLDPNAVAAAGGHASVTGFSVSPNGRIIAVNVDHGGNEITSVEFYDTDSGVKLPDQLDNIWGEFQVDWTMDSKAMTYTQMAPATADSDPMLNMRARYHVMGSATADDPILVAAGANATLPLLPQEFPIVAVSSQSDWAVVFAVGARAEARLCLVKKTDLLKADAAYNCLVNYEDGIQGANLYGDALYLLSKKTTPNGELLKIDLKGARPSLADARVVVPESQSSVITNINVARDGLYVRSMSNGIDSFTRLSHDGGTATKLDLPFDGAAFLTDSDPAADGLVFTLQSWTKPRQLLAYDPATRTVSDLHLGANAPKDYDSAIDIVNVEAPSADGTLVPVTLLVPKGTKPDGKALTLLDAYGAYGQATQPFFDPMTLEWVMKGHIYGFVAIRGGGEKGDAWRLGGKGPNKHKGIEDLMGAADYVVAKGYSSVAHVAITGASAGGIIMGGSVTHYPGHFGAAVIHAGMLNPSRLAVQANGPNQYAEFGDATTADGFDALYQMDAYLAVKPGQVYPPVMLDVGLNDNRVAPWNSGKFGAALKAAGAVVTFRTDSDSGHFGTSLSQAAAEKADHYTFLEKVMGADGVK